MPDTHCPRCDRLASRVSQLIRDRDQLFGIIRETRDLVGRADTLAQDAILRDYRANEQGEKSNA